jgi:hypothetical protein
MNYSDGFYDAEILAVLDIFSARTVPHDLLFFHHRGQ